MRRVAEPPSNVGTTRFRESEQVMVGLQVESLAGAPIDRAAIDSLRDSLRGQLLRPGDDGYDAARQLWNAMIDKRPSLIARCTGVADVIAAVNFARDQNMLTAVCGGGHNVAGNAVCDGGIMIDLSPMRGVRVDPVNRRAYVQGGATWGDLDHETDVFGLATTGGVVSTTGVAGLTLGGGIGWLMRKHGLACDNLLSVDVVTADGRLVTASERENPDLFWGVRGGGGNFGVVTSFEFRLHPVSLVTAGRISFPWENAREAIKLYRDYTKEAPEELGWSMMLWRSPGGVRLVRFTVCYNGSGESAERVLRPIRQFATAAEDFIAVRPYKEIQRMFEVDGAPRLSHYWKSSFMKDVSDEAIEVMLEHLETAPSPLSDVTFEYLGGAVSRVGENETVYGHRSDPYNFLVEANWENPADHEVNVRWGREFWEAMQPYCVEGVYVNYLGQEPYEGEKRIKAAYGPEKFDRLVALKNKYDPTNLFRLNQNIQPTV